MIRLLSKDAFIVPFIVAILLIQSDPASSQIGNYTNLPQFLNPEFRMSRVKMKDGKDLSVLLNYNMVTERMIFFQKEQVYDLSNPGSVDTIYMDEKKFVPYEKVFYEIIPGSNLTFFIQHKGRLMPAPKPAAYGGSSSVSSATYITRMDIGSQAYNMKLQDNLEIKYDPIYWVKIKDNMESFQTEKQMSKLFPGKEESIMQYMRKNRFKFNDHENLIKIFKFVNDLTK